MFFSKIIVRMLLLFCFRRCCLRNFFLPLKCQKNEDFFIPRVVQESKNVQLLGERKLFWPTCIFDEDELTKRD